MTPEPLYDHANNGWRRLCHAMRWPEPDPPTTRNRTIQAPRVLPPARQDTRTLAGFTRWRTVMRERGET